MIRITDVKEKAYFNIGSNEYYEGYHIEGVDWNGWAMPYFEKCIADLFINNFSTRDFKITYDESTDCYICETMDNLEVIQQILLKKQLYILMKEQKKYMILALLVGLGIFILLMNYKV